MLVGIAAEVKVHSRTVTFKNDCHQLGKFEKTHCQKPFHRPRPLRRPLLSKLQMPFRNFLTYWAIRYEGAVQMVVRAITFEQRTNQLAPDVKNQIFELQMTLLKACNLIC